MFRFKLAFALVFLCVAFMATAGAAQAWTYEGPNANAQGASTPTSYSLSHIRVTGDYIIGGIGVPIHTAAGYVHGKIVVYDLSDTSRPIYSFNLSRQVPRAQKVWVEISPSSLSLQNGRDYAIGFVPGSNFYGSVYYNDNSPGTEPDVSPSSAIQTIGNVNRNFVSSTNRSFGLKLELVAGLNISPPVIEGDAEEIPTLTEWSMILLALGLGGGAAIVLSRRRRRG